MSQRKGREIDSSTDVEADVEADVGFCGACTFAWRVENRRGAIFYMCGRSAADPRYPKYPLLPVLECPGFVAIPASSPLPPRS